jgi:hypothetical protein
MFYLLMLIYINKSILSQTNISHTRSNKHNQHFIQPTTDNSLADTRREI